MCTRTFANNAIVTADSEEPIGYSPTQIRHAYRISDKGGSGQTIAIIANGDDPNAEADLKEYRSHYGFPACTVSNGCFRKRDENGNTSNFPSADVSSALETSIDLDMASVACQECNLLLIEGNMTTAVDTAVALGATEISISQGVPDANVSLKANKHFNHPGIPITASAGDHGYRNFQTGGNAPDYPATAPGVIAVGGTELTPAPGTPRGWVDNVWEDTGGGCSVRMPRPDWQNFISCGTKMTSDVSIVAANVPVYDSYGYKPAEYWHTMSGTSIGAPLIAGIYAHTSRMVRDQPAKALYKDLAEGFGSIYDVGSSKTANNTNYNGYTCSPLYLCNAVAGKDGKPLEGYDGPTGVGVPQGIPVLPVWVEQSANELNTIPDMNLDDVDCASTTMCLAVGSANGKVEPAAAEWDGYEWSPISTPLEGIEGWSPLKGISCVNANFCVAVGEVKWSPPYSTSELYVIWWDGESWAYEEETLPLEPSVTGPESYSVSCTSTTNCMIVATHEHELFSLQYTGSGWSAQVVPLPGGLGSGGLEKVSCAAEEVENEEEEFEERELCLAVGWQYSETAESVQVLVERWDGYEWSVETSLTPPGDSSWLYDVSCPSVNSCMAAGWMAESPEYKDTVPLSEHWNGSEWVLGKPPLPEPEGIEAEEIAKEEEGEVYGVSCATPTSCVAVGLSFGNEGYFTDGWNGTSWSEQQRPDAPRALEQVDCVTVSSCEAFGGVGGSALFLGLAEDPAPYLGTGTFSLPEPDNATLDGTVNPNGTATTYQFEYGTTTSYGSKAPASPESIGSGTSPVEVSEKIESLKPETTYHFRLVATNENGAITEGEDQTFTTPAWKILSTPNPKEASDSDLYDVSCEPSTNVCTAVGKSTKSGVDSPLAQRWNGSSWSEQSPAKKSGSTHNRLLGVDCPSETRCLAVGNYQKSEGGPATLGELWNESKWSVQTTPVPSEASSSELVAVGCNSTANCRAAGSAVIKGTKTAIVEAWASPTWSSQTVPIPEGATSSQLDGIDCIWSNFCAAVGRYTTSGGSVKSLVMFWNGTEWTLQSATDPEGATESSLLDVSCTPTPNRCTAVGDWKNSEGEQFTLAYRFNGVTTWTLQSTPNPAEGIESVLQDVSCASETSCTAAGSREGAEGTTETLAEKWNGTSWSIQGTSNPSGAEFSSLFGVSCRSTTCMGVGWSTDGSGVDTTLGEIRE